MSLANVIAALISLIGLLYVGFPILPSFLIFNGILLFGMTLEFLSGRNGNTIDYSKPSLEKTIDRKNKTIIHQGKQKYSLSFYRIQYIPEGASLSNLCNLKEYQIQIIEISEYVFLICSLKMPKRNDIDEFVREKRHEFAIKVKQLIPGLIFSPISDEELKLIYGFKKPRNETEHSTASEI